MAANEAIAAHQRCVSPSDFGFHNAIRRPDGTFAFIDFEYAGWDDPAKTVCDVFLQPAIPVPRDDFERFTLRALSWIANREATIARCRGMFPLFAIKWCCIILNPFVPEWIERSHVADRSEDLQTIREKRLERAEVLTDQLHLV